MPEFLKQLVSADGFIPHGHCYLWRPALVWLHAVSDALTALAYTSIPFTLIYFVRKRRDLPFHWMFLCFGVFIIACGATHWLEIWTLWTPTYWLSGLVKAITAAASLPTAVLLVKLVPRVLRLPSPQQLARAHHELQRAHEALARRLEERCHVPFHAPARSAGTRHDCAVIRRGLPPQRVPRTPDLCIARTL